MDELELNKTEGILINEYILGEKLIYIFITEKGHIPIETFENDIVNQFIIAVLGQNKQSRIGKTLTLISDDRRLLSLYSSKNRFVLTKDYTHSKNQNSKYVKTRYGLTSQELRQLIKEFMQSKTRSKKIN